MSRIMDQEKLQALAEELAASFHILSDTNSKDCVVFINDHWRFIFTNEITDETCSMC